MTQGAMPFSPSWRSFSVIRVGRSSFHRLAVCHDDRALALGGKPFGDDAAIASVPLKRWAKLFAATSRHWGKAPLLLRGQPSIDTQRIIIKKG
jgi:hypothetical protein